MDHEREFVIGQDLADAHAADARHLADGPPPSPLPAGRYRHERGELGLFSIGPVALDEALTAFVRHYRGAAADERARLRDGIEVEGAYTLLAFARRATVFALRSRDAALVADGLGACSAVPYERIDARDGLVALALLHHAGRRCGAGSAALFEAARELGDVAFANLIDAFLARSDADRDLQAAWGYIEAEGPRGAGLLGWGLGPWSPSVDLAAITLRVASALDGDEYLIEDPMLGFDLSAIWLSASADPGLEPTLGRIRAGAVIHGRLRAEATAEPGSQQLTVWVLECAGPDDAALLARLARRPREGDALLGMADGPVFVLVVARSVVVGVAAHETCERVARFGSRLRAALRR